MPNRRTQVLKQIDKYLDSMKGGSCDLNSKERRKLGQSLTSVSDNDLEDIEDILDKAVKGNRSEGNEAARGAALRRALKKYI